MLAGVSKSGIFTNMAANLTGIPQDAPRSVGEGRRRLARAISARLQLTSYAQVSFAHRVRSYAIPWLVPALRPRSDN